MVAVGIILGLVAMWLMAIMVDRVIDRVMAESYALHLAYYHDEKRQYSSTVGQNIGNDVQDEA